MNHNCSSKRRLSEKWFRSSNGKAKKCSSTKIYPTARSAIRRKIEEWHEQKDWEKLWEQ
ncbi:hypothetical protein M9194_07615 [Vibrio sp. S4M6]|uniref:hypothetical protein n=1 Tax=Vibrio sinus TaxID=2946865 RepID=UPI002029F889|nr:hypothetical protein [Vibrio sinus]MCL9781295.1 hypothetical protein [Vibrio sinus]